MILAAPTHRIAVSLRSTVPEKGCGNETERELWRIHELAPEKT
jgi:hypothetical protein